MAWPPLTASSVDALLALNPDPLNGLLRGDYPAIVVRGALRASHAHDASRRLLHQQPDWWEQRSASYAVFGVDLHSCLQTIHGATHSAERESAAQRYANATQRFEASLRSRDLSVPTDTLRTVLGALHAAGARQRQRPPVPRDGGTDKARGGSSSSGPGGGAGAGSGDALMASPGIFRRQLSGNTFPPHADTLHSLLWSKACHGKPMATSMAFPQLHRYRHQFSALVSLQQPGDAPDETRTERDTTASAEVQLFDAHWRDLLHACNDSAHGVRGTPYEVGVAFTAWKTHDWQRAGRGRAHNLSLGVGDVYIFNSNRVHEVLPVQPGKPRLTLGTFVGYDEHAGELLAWS